MRRFLLPIGMAWLLVLCPSGAPAQTAPELREEGVLYFEGNLPNKITATLKAPLTVFLRRDFLIAAAYLSPGQTVEVLGMSPEGYLVKGTFRNNTVSGWIQPENLPPGIDPSLFEAARKNQERHDAVAVAIANKSVIQGMTPDEVKQSLGKPDQVSSKTDATGTKQTWTFITYREEPQYNYVLGPYGQAIQQTYYVKVPIGQLIVNFDDSGVISTEQHTTDPNSTGVVTR